MSDIFADRGVGWEYQQARCIFGDAEFLGRAEHAGRFDAANLGNLDRKITGQCCARQGTGHFEASGHIRGAANDLLDRAAADVDAANVQAVSVRMLVNFKDMGYYNAVKGRSNSFFFFDLKSCHGQKVRKLASLKRRVNKAA